MCPTDVVRLFLPIYDRMSRRHSRRSGVVSRIFSPVNEGLRFVTNAGSNVFNAGKGVWRIAGSGTRRILGRATQGLNAAGSRLLSAKRQSGGRKSRKNRKNRH